MLYYIITDNRYNPFELVDKKGFKPVKLQIISLKVQEHPDEDGWRVWNMLNHFYLLRTRYGPLHSHVLGCSVPATDNNCYDTRLKTIGMTGRTLRQAQVLLAGFVEELARVC